MADGSKTPEGILPEEIAPEETAQVIDPKTDSVSTRIKKLSEFTRPINFDSIREGVGLDTSTGGLEPGKAINEMDETINDLTVANEKLSEENIRDPLTGLYNRRYLEKELALAQEPYGLLMMDIDNFKKENDTYGHAVGDEILKHLARILSASVETGDIIARYGGEEFVILLPRFRDKKKLKRRAENIRIAFESSYVEVNNDPTKKIWKTISMGGTIATDQMGPEKVLRTADEAMYEIKRGQKNGVLIV